MLKRQEYLLGSHPKGFRTVRNLSTFLFTYFWLSASFGFIQIAFLCASFLITLEFCTLNPLHVAGNASIKNFRVVSGVQISQDGDQNRYLSIDAVG